MTSTFRKTHTLSVSISRQQLWDKHHCPTGALFSVHIMIIALVVFTGCAGTEKKLENKIVKLNRNLEKMRVEKTNIQAKNRELSDKLVIMETKLEKYLSKKKINLPVIKIKAPENAARRYPDNYKSSSFQTSNFSYSSEPQTILDDNDRPRLTLNGQRNETWISSTSLRQTNSTTKKLKSPFVDGAENLGVVPIDGISKMDIEGSSMTQFNAAYKDYANGNYVAALEKFSLFLQNNTNSKYCDDALFWRGKSFLSQGKQLNAIREFEIMMRRYPGSNKGALTLYSIGIAYKRLHDRQKASEYFFKVVEKYPSSASARKSTEVLKNLGSDSLIFRRTSAKR